MPALLDSTIYIFEERLLSIESARGKITKTAASTVKDVMDSKFSVAQTGGDRSPTTPNPHDWTDILAVKTSVLAVARDMYSDPDMSLMMELETVARMVVLQALAIRLKQATAPIEEQVGTGEPEGGDDEDDEYGGLIVIRTRPSD